MDAEKTLKEIGERSDKYFEVPTLVAAVYIHTERNTPFIAYVSDGHSILALAKGKKLEPVLTELSNQLKNAADSEDPNCQDEDHVTSFIAMKVPALALA